MTFSCIYYKTLIMHKISNLKSHAKRYEHLSTFFRELRINEGMTQRDLSQNLNLHRNTIIRAENAKNLTLLSVFELADALEISVKDLFQDIE
jgi:DNA-binding XRE family transcriptional regulator